MSKKFNNQYCVHCLGYFEDLTEDHIFPESWYPDSTPQNMEKWVVPACFACNNKLGRIEEETYKKLALCLNGNEIAASGVSEKANRLYKPSFAKDERDKRRKEANVRKIIPDLLYTEKMPMGLMNNCGPDKDDHGKLLLVHISIPKLLDPFAKKVVRGLEFKFRNKLIDPSVRKITIIHPPVGIDDMAPSEMLKLNNVLNISGAKVDRGPGFVVRRAIDIYGTSLYHITIWGKVEIWGEVFDKNLKIMSLPEKYGF